MLLVKEESSWWMSEISKGEVSYKVWKQIRVRTMCWLRDALIGNERGSRASRERRIIKIKVKSMNSVNKKVSNWVIKEG